MTAKTLPRSVAVASLALTDAKIARTKANSVTQWPAGKGLYLKANWRVGSFHVWRFDFTNPTTGKRDTMTLGKYPAVSIDQAQQLADEAREVIAQGKCPKVARDNAKRDRIEASRLIADGKAAPGTVRAVGDMFLASRWVPAAKRNGRPVQWSDDYATRWNQVLGRHVYPVIGDKQCRDVTAADVYSIISTMDAHGLHAYSAVARIHLKQIFSLALVLGLATSDPVAPVAVVVRRQRAVTHAAALFKPGELVELLAGLKRSENITKRAALLASFYTAQRPGNVQQMEWSELDLGAGLWTIPSAKMKRSVSAKGAGDNHVVPLCRQLVEELRRVLAYVEKDAAGVPVCPFVFANQEWRAGRGKPLAADRMRDELNRLGFRDRQSLHGFRATWRTTCQESLGLNPKALEFQLGHGNGETLGPAYWRGTLVQERAEAVQKFADYVDALTASGEVIEMKRAA